MIDLIRNHYHLRFTRLLNKVEEESHNKRQTAVVQHGRKSFEVVMSLSIA
jgi:hypothetical protein